jgi:hypothetical protein
MRDPPVFVFASSTSPATVDLRDTGDLGCRVVGKLKGSKARATWRDSGFLQNIGSSELWEIWDVRTYAPFKGRRLELRGNTSGVRDSEGHACRKERGRSAPNTEFPTSLCDRRGLGPVVGLVDGWTFPAEGRNLEMV